MTLAVLKEDSVFANRYRVVRSIAHGGMGAVYEAIHLETGRPCAIKVLLPNLVESEEIRERFRREARVTATIRSEFIVDVFDAGIDEATSMPFLVMELLHGEELGKQLKRVKRIAPEDVLLYLHQAALALDKAHRASIVHRDLKPANLFLTTRDDGSPLIKLLDFGIAKMIADGATGAGATQSLGTPMYMAPEQFIHGERVSAASDIYALGMMAYTLLVGSAYWADEAKGGSGAYAFIALAVKGPAEPATARAARRGVALPAAFDAWFAKATAVSPADRFESASAAVRGLAEVLSVPVPSIRAPMSTIPADGGAMGSTNPTPLSVPSLSVPTPLTVMTAPQASAPPKRQAAFIFVVASALALGGIAAGVLLSKTKTPETPPAPPAATIAAAPTTRPAATTADPPLATVIEPAASASAPPPAQPAEPPATTAAAEATGAPKKPTAAKPKPSADATALPVPVYSRN